MILNSVCNIPPEERPKFKAYAMEVFEGLKETVFDEAIQLAVASGDPVVIVMVMTALAEDTAQCYERDLSATEAVQIIAAECQRQKDLALLATMPDDAPTH